MKPNPQPKPPESKEETPAMPSVVDNNAVLLNAGAALSNIRFITNGGSAPVAIVPDGYQLKFIPLQLMETWQGKPNRKTGWYHFDDVPSFIRYFNEHATEDARIFAKITDTGAKFYGILNFHGKEPSFNDHLCVTALRETHEWNVWMQHANKFMTQPAFALFLEENSDLFLEPRGADLLELVADLEGKAHVDINQAVKLQTGAISLKYTETVELKAGSASQSGELTVPKEITVEIAPFEGTRQHTMKARLRYRIENKKILFAYEPIDPHLIIRVICAELLDNIESQTQRVPFKIAPGGLNPYLASIENNQEDEW